MACMPICIACSLLACKMSKMSSSPSRILVIAPNWIGDAVMAQPLLALLVQQYPGQAIDVVAAPWVAPVLHAMPQVAEVLTVPFRHGALQLRERWRFAKILRARGYAAAYVLPNTLKFALLPWLARIRLRIGYKGEHRYGLINRMHVDDPVAPRAMVPYYAALAFAPAPQAPSALPRPRLEITQEAKSAVLQTLGLDQATPIVVFAPGAEFGNAKRWPSQHFAALAQLLAEANAATQILLLGSAKDQAVCDEIVQLVQLHATNAANVKSAQLVALAGKTSLDQALALIACAAAVVSNDSGLLHIASALNRPVIALYGSTDPDHAPPFADVAYSLSLRLACAPCKQRECPLGHHDCMEKMNPSMVWQPLRQILHDQHLAQ